MKRALGFFILTYPIVTLLSGCAQLEQAYIQQTCNTDAAYAAGVNDAKNNVDMQANYASSCPANVAELNDTYRKGYEFSLSQVSQGTRINIYRPPHDHYHTFIK
jgi:hypothetical protein